ncbi:ATP-dependent RNA helicase HrpA [Bordetella hinzii]|uniref:ATP-dependent RNA helicase HrpA n=1 Tax=Bordetella hinzii TaxID=103855 RepID=A0AAN1RZ75_9BORD|nr:ATP-dependent RNA helicase HrpA [Bordetella hinzii]AKQ60839.1 ATP-dependent RNA helicase HrpB [Bordetella hinzii]AZW18143.1 ATP-dependent RNA helicase HrpA [Bordetella hinzii]KCB40461.1 ATP-dependent helicase HrpA [Bordetella hinzii 5132]KCB49006.1 ATP-dependent helicase HrpA [Bordetella hinzii 4161]KCB52584.1 ATP-dependent helicase HrpA [Bordetella hinzii 1277]
MPETPRPAAARRPAPRPDRPERADRPERPIPVITYPEDLPVSARRQEIARAIAAHQVVIVSGETGSGKTTQLPKICLELGRGRRAMIGHTQPRRLAATSVAKRIAEELNTPMGEVVGYQVRFNDRTGPNAAIKLMTDGILLAESQRDPLLKRYDTIIIDEAHERSLNIDFLLGYLRQLLPRRPDLKVVITSATIDAERFARHFADAQDRPAPVIEVSGRLYPVEVRYRPVQPPQTDEAASAPARPGRERLAGDEERDLVDAIVDAVDECARHGPGDVLVFLPGEREIRESAEALRKRHPVGTEILPLYARLSQAEQEQIFHPRGNSRRVVLATNVAETSLTVPGIRFVVDSGLARIKRYSWRNKVEQLRIEPISRASANQRAGRCGRVGPGVCIRLYDETDFNARAPFTDPEVLRSSLASVILRMKALKLDDIEQFPFVEAPPGRAVADGYHLLQELGAIEMSEDEGEGGKRLFTLTRIGQDLARLPVDPRIGRMILAAREQQCLSEMLIIAAALSVQDPRDRPMQEREASEAAHAKFADDKSEFLSFLKLWRWYGEQVQHKASQRKLVALLRQNFLSPIRLREWHDVHTQLAALVGEQGWRLNQSDATYEQLHLALLTGLLGNIGFKSEEGGNYLGARDIRFHIHPGSRLAKKAGRWVMAAELVETTRLYARCVARIEPVWIERVAAHLLRRNWSDPRWEKKAGQVVANERATLYGLAIYSGRRVQYGRINPEHARELFIRQALVPGEIDTRLAFVAHNRKLIAGIEKLEHQARRPDILVDDELIYAFYDRQIPAGMSQTATLEKWVGGLDKETAARLMLTREELMRHEAAGVTTDVFPKKVEWQGVSMALDYHFEPGSPRDGVTLSVPLFALNQIDAQRCEWLVPGMLKEKVHLLLKSLPQKLRRHCVPLPDYAAGFYDRWFERAADPGMGLVEALIEDMWKQVQVRPIASDFKLETLPAHLFMNFKVVDEHGRMLAAGRNLAQLKADLGKQAQATFQQLAARDSEVAQALAHENLTAWTFGPLPEIMEIRRGGQSVIGYPALVDRGGHCDLDVFDDPDEARRHHRAGLLRLFRIGLREQVKFLEKNLTDLTKMSMFYMTLGTQDELRDQIIDCALAQACLGDPWPVNEQQFEARRQDGKGRLGLLAQEVARLSMAILTEYAALQRKLPQAKPHAAAYADLQQQIGALMPKWFVRDIPYAQLAHYPRYLKAAVARIDKLRADPARDARLVAEMAPLLTQYQRARAALKGAPDPRLDEFRWLLEELRVALFAQELRTPMPVSVKRLMKTWEAMRR